MTAEIQLMVRGTDIVAGYEDGDFLDVFTDRRKRCVHASHICDVRLAGFNADRLRDVGTVFEDWQNLTYQYKFTRINRTQVERFDGTTTDTFGPESMDVSLYLQRRKASPKHRIFGTTGNEIWYGGRKDFSNTALDAVWAAIESKTDNLESNFPLWPAGVEDLKSFLFIKVNNISDADANDLVAPLFEVDGITIKKKRKSFANWRNFAVAGEGDILDQDVTIDVRSNAAVNHNLFLETKT